jgi:sugar/nucleoside kinase (ribokinase family)
MDRLEVHGAEVRAPGGSGFNTALAARCSGIDTGLVAAVPTHLPGVIGAAFGPGGIRRDGLVVRKGPLASFHIAYDSHQNADYRRIELTIERTLSAADVPEPWLEARHIHVGPLGASSRRQLEFVRGLRERGFAGTVSAGSFLSHLDEDRSAAHGLAAETSIFFLNRSEFTDLYPHGPPERPVVVVTDGSRGVTVYDGGQAQHHPAPPVEVVDPTGAGDAFYGGYLAGWLGGSDPVAAAFAAAAVALSGYGSSALVERVAAMVGSRVRLDDERITAVARMLATEARAASLDFTGFPLPEEGEPAALETLALATLHQYGFWLSDASGWVEPMYAVAEGRRFKGSDYIWQAFTRAVRRDPTVVDPRRLAAERYLFDEICADDTGACPVPDVESHRDLQQAYGAAIAQAGGFRSLLAEANAAQRPGSAFLERLAVLPGYREDPLAKKANLLVVVLANRPEQFLDLRDPESVTPIVDYHLMRSCLRTGCVEISDPELRARVETRAWVDETEEDLIRRACFEAIDRLVAASGLTQDAVDGFFFSNARRVCVEQGRPDCDDCRAAAVCARRIELFQPVMRTTAY